MKKYIIRFLVAILAFFIGTATIYFFAWDKIKTLNPYRATHSAENKSPYSVLEGAIVRIEPYNATFEIPESWVSYKPLSIEPPKNLYLNWQDLNELNQLDFNNGFSDEDDAQVMRSVVSFENCAAHVGSMSWGNPNTGDLQAGIFVADLNSKEITERIKNQGLSKARNVFKTAKLSSENYGTWEKQNLGVLKTGSHTLLFKDIDFYYRSFDGKTVVFVFVHQSGWDEQIKLILDSFKWGH